VKNESRFYLLDPQKIPPETIAVTFAKTSRSPLTFEKIAAELTDQKSSEFNEKWVVGYGHSSVAEHAVLHVAVENVSRLAVETLESNRLASYTEKSTRYQTWDDDAFYIPRELSDHRLLRDYVELCNALFGLYKKLIPCLNILVEDQLTRLSGEAETVWKRRVNSLTIDICRYVLPAASLANVGVTINARALEQAISKMLSSPLLEVRQMGESIKECALIAVPTLLKYAKDNPYVNNVGSILSRMEIKKTKPQVDWCQLVDYDHEAENHILAAALYRFQNISYTQAIETINQSNREELIKLAQVILNEKDQFTIPLRELEHSSFTFDVTLDQGAYYEVKRHRMMTLTPQAFSPHLGYAIPRLIAASGVFDSFNSLMEKCQHLFPELEQLQKGLGAYILPNCFNRRFLLRCNLRSVIHFINLRSAPNAHFAVRRLAQRMAEQLCESLPIFAPYLFCNRKESSIEIEKQYFVDREMR
jgi:thymidylate synthase ThyX